MEQTTLLTDAINLTLFGMGFVFLFLTLLVFVTKLMSMVVQKLGVPTIEATPSLTDEINEETKFIIEQAIKLHRGA